MKTTTNIISSSNPERFQPADLVEMVNARWRQRRCNNIETDLFGEQMDTQKGELDKTYVSYSAPVEHSTAFRTLSDSGYLANLNRMQSQLERTYTHALRDLLRLQQLRESKQQAAERTVIMYLTQIAQGGHN